MPLRKHRQNFRNYSCCFTASAAVDWLHQLLCNNSNFGPDVTRQQTVQLLKKFLKNHVIEDVKGRWGAEDLEDNAVLYRWEGFRSFKVSGNCSEKSTYSWLFTPPFSPGFPPPPRWRKSPVHRQLQPLLPLRKDHLSETKKAYLSLRVSQRMRRRQRWGEKKPNNLIHWNSTWHFHREQKVEENKTCIYLCFPGQCRPQCPIRRRKSACRSAGAETTTDWGGWTGDLEVHHLNPVKTHIILV